MIVHLYTTDISALDLLFPASDQIVAVIVPANRARTEKVGGLTAACPYPIFIHHGHEGQITDTDGHETLGPADIGASWLFTQKFSNELLARYPRGILNFHAGEPGPHALRRALQEKRDGVLCFWHRCVTQVDAGERYAEAYMPLGAREAFESARHEMIRVGQSMFPQAWAGFKQERRAA